MPEKRVPYERNDHLANSPLNLPFTELQHLAAAEFAEWAKEFRKETIYAWDMLGVPIVGGQPEDAIIQDFKRLATLDVSGMLKRDDLTGQVDCIVQSGAIGAKANQFFPTMLKTKDIATKSLDGTSIYDHFAIPELLERFVDRLRQTILQDPIGLFSDAHLRPEDLQAQIASLRERGMASWFAKSDGKDVRRAIEKSVARSIGSTCPILEPSEWYTLRSYNSDRRLMDNAKLFRLVFGGTPATNFPPAVAKFLYNRFAQPREPGEKVIVYDPSSGWGGRILGALAIGNNKPVHYIGTDPNSDHWMPELGMTKYEYLAQYFHGNVPTTFQTTCHLFREGSEDIDDNLDFDRYRGKIDFIFTSPPYFAVEGYSDEATQSYKKFPTYEDWRDHFLRKTLATCAEWLRDGGYLCLNIADIRLDSKVYPLQVDAATILTSLGLAQHPTLKMVLQDAPGGAKTTKSGSATTRNFCKVAGRVRKYEPILVFQKLIGHDEHFQ